MRETQIPQQENPHCARSEIRVLCEVCDLCHHHIPALECRKMVTIDLVWAFGFPLEIHSKIDYCFTKVDSPKPAQEWNDGVWCG